LEGEAIEIKQNSRSVKQKVALKGKPKKKNLEHKHMETLMMEVLRMKINITVEPLFRS
jgi:hypothetical protein